MLSEGELQQDAAQLDSFRQASKHYQETLTQVLERYSTLMDDYKRLRSDYEEERDARERYKQMARGQERNPFVLVLVDGDGYVFDDDLVSNGGEGGQRAANLLNEAVKRSLRDRGLEHCRIMVRIYANLVGLSKALSKAKLAGPEKRSLAPFVANFNRSAELFDFVDAGELKENADAKIRALFRLYAENSQCRHIYFAGCHDVGYINDLTQYASQRDRITLVRSHALHPEFARLGLRIEELSGIFRSLPLDGQTLAYRTPTAAVQPTMQPPVQPPTPSAKPCFFFQQGKCKYGKACHNLHERPNGQPTSAAVNLTDINQWRSQSSTSSNDLPFQMSHLTKSDNQFMSGNIRANTVQDNAHSVVTSLPQEIPDGKIAINKDKYRLDAHVPEPSAEDRRLFNERTKTQRLCNNYHLRNGNCRNLFDCQFDHSPITKGVRNVLKQLVRGNFCCPKKGTCRRADCMAGHICAKPDCGYRGGKAFCKYPPYSHTQDLKVAQFVDAEPPRGGEINVIIESDNTDSFWSTDEDGEDGVYGDHAERVAGEDALLDVQDDGASVD